MGRFNREYLGGKNVYLCKKCNNYLTNHENLISDKFRGQTGTAYLFKLVVNIDMFEIEKKPMTTGYHMVRDIGCKCCKTRIGWVYEFAFESSQEYKEGHFIIEKNYIILVDGLPGDKNFVPFRPGQSSSQTLNPSNNGPTLSESDFGYQSLESFNFFNNSFTLSDSENALLQQFRGSSLFNSLIIPRQTRYISGSRNAPSSETAEFSSSSSLTLIPVENNQRLPHNRRESPGNTNAISVRPARFRQAQTAARGANEINFLRYYNRHRSSR